MGRITWDPALETGDAVIDGHHQELFGMVDDLHQACVTGCGRSVVGDILDQLAAYVEKHFAAEEALMVRTGYPPLDAMAHMRAHSELREKAAETIAQYRSGGIVTVLPLSQLLFDWLRSHIRDLDARFIAHAKSVGEHA